MDYDGGKSVSWDWARVGKSFHEFRSFGTLVAQLGHILEIACRRWIAGRESAEVRATNEAWVAEFTDKPLTIEVAETLVDAVR